MERGLTAQAGTTLLHRYCPRGQHSAQSLSRAFRRRLRDPFGKLSHLGYLVAEEDRMINPATQFFLAQRMGARIRSEKVDHTPLVTAPGPVSEVILEAVASSSA
jgi:hypothetical protein